MKQALKDLVRFIDSYVLVLCLINLFTWGDDHLIPGLSECLIYHIGFDSLVIRSVLFTILVIIDKQESDDENTRKDS